MTSTASHSASELSEYARHVAEQKTPPMATPRVAAGVIFRDDQGRVLLVKPTYKDGWDVPGGYVEPGESPRGAASREVYEELGIKPAIGRLLVVDWAPHPNEGDKILFLFDGGKLNEAESLSFIDGEIERAEFHAKEDLSDYTPDRLSRRIANALENYESAKNVYIEHGHD